MSIEKFLLNRAVRLYLLDLIDMKYINLDKSYIIPSGTVLYNIDVDKLPEFAVENETVAPREILESAIFDFAYNYKYVMDKLFCVGLNKKTECDRKVLPDKTDEYYIPYVVSPVGRGENHLTTIAVRHKEFLMFPPDDFITETMNWLKGQSEYNYYKSLINNFVTKANEWVREQIRQKLFDSKINGVFHQDLIKDNVYFNRRTVGDSSVTYIINDWFTHYAKGCVKFIDIDNGKGLIYAALNG